MESLPIGTAVAVLALLALVTYRGFADAVREAIERFTGNFRGGPPTHPSPANDTAILTRRPLKRRSDF